MTSIAEGNWVLHPTAAQDQLELASLDFQCPREAVYEDVRLERHNL